jgi:hypothetical protein
MGEPIFVCIGFSGGILERTQFCGGFCPAWKNCHALPQGSPSLVFTDTELRLLDHADPKPSKAKKKTLSDYLYAVARLGGYLSRAYNPPPGNMVSWRGFTRPMNIVETQQRVAKGYFADGSYQQACPPLQALLSIMTNGHYNGLDVHHPDIRRMFTRDYLLASDWYMRRLQTRQKRDAALWQRNVAYVKRWIEDHPDPRAQSRLQIQYRLAVAQKQLARVQSDDYLRNLQGYMGADPLGS